MLQMKCVGASEGQPCQRCKRSGSEYALVDAIASLPLSISLDVSLKSIVVVASQDQSELRPVIIMGFVNHRRCPQVVGGVKDVASP